MFLICSLEQVGSIQQILMRFGKAEDGQAVAACGRVESLASDLVALVTAVEDLLWDEWEQRFQVTKGTTGRRLHFADGTLPPKFVN